MGKCFDCNEGRFARDRPSDDRERLLAIIWDEGDETSSLSVLRQPNRRICTIAKLSNDDVAFLATNRLADVDVQKSISLICRVTQRFFMEDGAIMFPSSRYRRVASEV